MFLQEFMRGGVDEKVLVLPGAASSIFDGKLAKWPSERSTHKCTVEEKQSIILTTK